MSTKTQTLEYEDPNVTLQFKEHREFFIEFFEIRKAINHYLVERDDPLKLITRLDALINWTTGYLSNVDKYRKIITQLKNNDANDVWYNTAQKLFDDITKEHVANEILPKPQKYEDPIDKLWESQETSEYKEMVKGFLDVMRNM